MNGLLSGKRIVVTGAARGLGYHFARACVEQGAAVVMCDILKCELAESAHGLSEQGYAIESHVIDLADPHSIEQVFSAIGEQFGEVDLAIMENGQYDQDWKYIHMQPDETAQAAVDIKAKAVVPGHNGRFVLAKHTWDDPLIQLTRASKDKDYRLLTPEPGEPVDVSSATQHFREWWK